VLALAAVGGVWLVSFALVAVNTGIVIAIRANALAPRLIGVAGALIAVAAGPAAFALTAPSPVARTASIALVQPGLNRDPSRMVAANEQLTTSLIRQDGRPDLVVWGESSVGFDLRTDARLLHRLQALSGRAGVQILASQDAVSPAGQQSKVAVLIGANGIDGEYVKSRLVPFGEYIPFRSDLGWLTRISKAAPQNMVTGAGAVVLQATPPGPASASDAAPRLPIGVLICFESAFPDMSRYDADHGAQVIIYQTSDSTFQGSWALAQHASLGALRAAETGRPVVQAALTGDSAAFDSRGRLLAWVNRDRRTAVTVRLSLPAATVRTPFDVLGDYVPLTALAVLAVAVMFGLARRGHNARVVAAYPEGPAGSAVGIPSSDGPAAADAPDGERPDGSREATRAEEPRS
jgi:apolipoprotein N-acyltransferase